jgi:predicted transcriptional regulator
MKRNNLDICADILRVSKGGAKKTHLVYQANLNFKIVKKYITELIEKELLEMNGDRFYITDKGSEFIERYETLVSPLANRLFLE